MVVWITSFAGGRAMISATAFIIKRVQTPQGGKAQIYEQERVHFLLSPDSITLSFRS